MASHPYSAAGTYTVTLHVTDNDGALGTFSASVVVEPVAPPARGVNFRYYDFFDVPYGEWWDIRYFTAGFGDPSFADDRAIGAECFNPDGPTYNWCFPVPDDGVPDFASYPYTNWQRSPVDTTDGFIYAPYRFEGTIADNAAYTVDRPVLLPSCTDLKAFMPALVCPTTAPTGGSVQIDATLSYVTTPRALALIDRGCPDLSYLNDGYLSEYRMTVTMDNTAANRLFGVTDPAAWTPGAASTALIALDCGTGTTTDPKSGLAERGYLQWLESQGNGPYDVYNSFRLAYKVYAVEAFGSYDPASGKHSFTLDVVTWGQEVLLSRWFYWGATSHRDGTTAGALPAGWWGMEAPWMEDVHFVFDLGATSFSGMIAGVQQNHFRHSAEAGTDTLWNTADDVPKWVWQPVLADRLAPSVAHPASELRDYYAGSPAPTYVHTTVGTIRYGLARAYDYVPAAWTLPDGHSWKFEFPTRTAVLYSPASPKTGDPGTLIAISTAITYAGSLPTGLGTYDAVARVLTVRGPISLGTYPTIPSGKPAEPRPQFSLKR